MSHLAPGLERAADLIRGSSLSRRPRLRELAAAAGLSRFYFHRLFKQHFGETPLQMSMRLRVEAAKQLMRQGLPLREVADQCGFCNQPLFSAQFKRSTGVAPRRWLDEVAASTAPPTRPAPGAIRKKKQSTR